MRIRPLARIPQRPAPGSPSVRVRTIGRTAAVGLKVITMGPRSSTQLHSHSHRHLVIVLGGSGRVEDGEGDRQIGPDDVIVTAPDEPHAFSAGPDADLRFVCLDASGTVPRNS
ncbi:MAG: cupin domain-containing protein [Candidatus Limnocylindria bacterium]